MPQIMSINEKLDAREAARLARINAGNLMQTSGSQSAPGVNNPSQFSDPDEVVELGGEEVSTVADTTTPTKKEVSKPVESDDSGEEVSTTAPDKKTESATTGEVTKKSDDANGEADQKLGEALFDIPEPAKVEKKPATEVAKPGAQPAVPAGPRNYESFPEQIRPILKALNNAQFKEHAPKLKELYEKAAKAEELEARVSKSPQFFYEHPEAYRLTPEFNQLEARVQYINFETQHYADQLVKIKRGEPWQNLKGYDQQTGEPVFETVNPPEDGKPDYAAETHVAQHLNKLGALGMQKQTELAGFQRSYSQSVQQAQVEMKEIDKRLFPKIQDVTQLPPEERKLYDLAVSLTPMHLRNHPLTTPLGKSFVMFMRVMKLYQQSVAETEKLRAQLEDRSAAEPATIPATGGIPKARSTKPGEIDPEEEVKLGAWDE